MGLCLSNCVAKNSLLKENKASTIKQYKKLQTSADETITISNTNTEKEKGFFEEIHKISLKDFRFLNVLGKGALGKVVLAEKIGQNSKYYAIKVLEKELIASKNQKTNIKNEKLILKNISHPFIVRLHYAFQTPSKLYLVMDFMQGGELSYYIKKSLITEEIACFLSAEILLALEYLHKKNIVFRDLKPYNIMLTFDGHIKLIDFGLAKKILQNKEKAFSFCGTMGYLAPEIYWKKGHDNTADWWSFGAVLYQMIVGKLPFYNKNHEEMYKNIENNGVKVEKNVFSNELYDLLDKLLRPNPEERLNNTDEIKKHDFFKNIDWKLLEEKKIESPLKLRISDNRDLKYFSTYFTKEIYMENDSNYAENYYYYSFIRNQTDKKDRLSI